MKFYVRDDKGQQIAAYDHPSELATFLKASYPNGDLSGDPVSGPGRTEVKDGDGKVIATVESVDPPNR